MPGETSYSRRSRSPESTSSSRHRRRRDDDYDSEDRHRHHHRGGSSNDYDSRRRRSDHRDYDDRDDRRRRRDDDREDRKSHSTRPAAAIDEGQAQWGKRAARSRSRSPGRPSLALAPQSDLAPSTTTSKDRQAAVSVEPDFKPSGLLAAETNTVNGVVLKYNEPPEARKPVRPWRLYVFRGKEQVDMLHVNRQSCYLLGRDRLVVDIPLDHPSTSKQHAALQFRQVIERNEFGDQKTYIKPFIIDLESANGTTVNDDPVPQSRYYELKSGDVLKFAYSTREYVLLTE